MAKIEVDARDAIKWLDDAWEDFTIGAPGARERYDAGVDLLDSLGIKVNRSVEGWHAVNDGTDG